MRTYLMQTICRTGIFIICAQALAHFRPNGSYEKYIKMLVSAMILLQLILPVSSFFTGDEEQGLAARVEWFEKQLELGMEQAVADYMAGEAVLEQMTLEEVRDRVEALGVQGAAVSGTEPVQEAGPGSRVQRQEAGPGSRVQGQETEPGQEAGTETREQSRQQIEIGNIGKIQVNVEDGQEGGVENGRGTDDTGMGGTQAGDTGTGNTGTGSTGRGETGTGSAGSGETGKGGA